MDCLSSSLMDTPGFMGELNNRALTGRIPVSGGMDLTTRCNLRCEHCYLNCGRNSPESPACDLPTGLVIRILDEAAAAGCLFFLMTGGEPLLRSDFAEIYLHAKRRGLLVAIFTNGTLIDGHLVDLFREWPPQLMEVTLYGATASTHDSITGVPGSHDHMRQGIGLLQAAHIRFGLKTMLMRSNAAEFEGMLDYARALGVKFRMDAALFPRLNGDRSPVALRVSPLVAVEKEFSVPGREAAWRKYLQGWPASIVPDELYDCAASRSYFHVTARGRLQPCIMTTDIGYDLTRGHFSDGWAALTPDRLVEGAESDELACRRCESRPACDACPSFFSLECGSKLKYSEYMCAIAKTRQRILRGAR